MSSITYIIIICNQPTDRIVFFNYPLPLIYKLFLPEQFEITYLYTYIYMYVYICKDIQLLYIRYDSNWQLANFVNKQKDYTIILISI